VANKLVRCSQYDRLCTVMSHTLPIYFIWTPTSPRLTLFPYTTLFRSATAPSGRWASPPVPPTRACRGWATTPTRSARPAPTTPRSEEHTSELQSREKLVCRLLLEKKKKNK